MPRFKAGKKQKPGTNDDALAAKKAASDAALTPEALAGLEEQLAASVGMSGPPGGC